MLVFMAFSGCASNDERNELQSLSSTIKTELYSVQIKQLDSLEISFLPTLEEKNKLAEIFSSLGVVTEICKCLGTRRYKLSLDFMEQPSVYMYVPIDDHWFSIRENDDKQLVVYAYQNSGELDSLLESIFEAKL